MTTHTLGDVYAVVEEIRTELHALRREITKQRANTDEVHKALVQAIHSVVADRIFTSGDLAEHAMVPCAADLNAALLRVVPRVNARAIGRTLRALEGRDLGGVRIERAGKDRDGILWRAVLVLTS